MAWIFLSVICFSYLATSDGFCRTEGDCPEDECCLAIYNTHLFSGGKCKKLTDVGERCSEREAKLDYFGGKYIFHCPCKNDLICRYNGELQGKADISDPVLKLNQHCMSMSTIYNAKTTTPKGEGQLTSEEDEEVKEVKDEKQEVQDILDEMSAIRKKLRKKLKKMDGHNHARKDIKKLLKALSEIQRTLTTGRVGGSQSNKNRELEKKWRTTLKSPLIYEKGTDMKIDVPRKRLKAKGVFKVKEGNYGRSTVKPEVSQSTTAGESQVQIKQEVNGKINGYELGMLGKNKLLFGTHTAKKTNDLGGVKENVEDHVNLDTNEMNVKDGVSFETTTEKGNKDVKVSKVNMQDGKSVPVKNTRNGNKTAPEHVSLEKSSLGNMSLDDRVQRREEVKSLEMAGQVGNKNSGCKITEEGHGKTFEGEKKGMNYEEKSTQNETPIDVDRVTNPGEFKNPPVWDEDVDDMHGDGEDDDDEDDLDMRDVSMYMRRSKREGRPKFYKKNFGDGDFFNPDKAPKGSLNGPTAAIKSSPYRKRVGGKISNVKQTSHIHAKRKRSVDEEQSEGSTGYRGSKPQKAKDPKTYDYIQVKEGLTQSGKGDKNNPPDKHNHRKDLNTGSKTSKGKVDTSSSLSSVDDGKRSKWTKSKAAQKNTSPEVDSENEELISSLWKLIEKLQKMNDKGNKNSMVIPERTNPVESSELRDVEQSEGNNEVSDIPIKNGIGKEVPSKGIFQFISNNEGKSLDWTTKDAKNTAEAKATFRKIMIQAIWPVEDFRSTYMEDDKGSLEFLSKEEDQGALRKHSIQMRAYNAKDFHSSFEEGALSEGHKEQGKTNLFFRILPLEESSERKGTSSLVFSRRRTFWDLVGEYK